MAKAEVKKTKKVEKTETKESITCPCCGGSKKVMEDGREVVCALCSNKSK